MLKIKEVTQIFGGLIALNNVSIVVKESEILGLIGPNGSGKTTLINVITGFCNPKKGSILFKKINITNQYSYNIAKMGLVRTFQHINLFPQMTALENVMTGRFYHMHSSLPQVIINSSFFTREKKECQNFAGEILSFVGLKGNENIKARNLPYGQQRLLEIARALATEPQFLLLDEPVAGMNEQESYEVATLIKKLQKKGVTILLVEHHMRFVMNLCERIIVLNSGVAIAEGIPEEIQNNEEVIKVYLGIGKGHKNA